MDPNVIIYSISGVSLLAGLVIFLFHLFNRKLHKNPYNLLLMGIIIVDEIMVIHLVFSIMQMSKRNLVGCQLVGLIGVFATFANAFYHYYLSELINSLSKVFNPKDLSHLKYHIYAIIFGLIASLISIIIEDIGITCFESCGTARGSLMEFLYSYILIFVWPFCLWSAIKCYNKIRTNQRILQDQKQLYICHISNILIFSVTWVPYITLHFLNFTLKLDLSGNSGIIKTVFLSLIALTPLLNTITRVFCDPSLKQKLFCSRNKVKPKDYSNLMEQLIDMDKNDAAGDLTMNTQQNGADKTHRNSQQIYDKLTQTETLNNLLSTFTGICMLMDDVFDLYFQNQLSTEIVDLLAQNELLSEEVFNKKVKRVYSLDSFNQKYNYNEQFTFPPDLEKNFQKNLAFKITEYSTLIFQNLRLRQKMSQDMFRESLLPYNNTKTLTKSFEKTSAKGGKPLIKTHDKRFLIKEVKKEERDFLMSILPKYHSHLKKHPNSLLAKIVGIYAIRIGDKDKVYHVLMESLDPIDESFIRFKYDLKFSTVNRREYKSRQEVKVVRDELLENNPNLEELFPKKKDLTSLHEIDKNNLGVKKLASSNGSDSRSRDTKSKSKIGVNKKTKSIESGGNNDRDKTKSQTKTNTNTNSGSGDQDDSEDDESEDNQILADDEEIDDDIENDEKFKQMDYEEQLVYREQKYLYKQQRMWNQDQMINLKENPILKAQLMGKLGLLKDSDFKCMHDRKLPVTFDDLETVEEFIRIIESDVRFLEGLRIMDYSLFLIVLEVPRYDDHLKAQGSNGSADGGEEEKVYENAFTGDKHSIINFIDPELRKKDEDLYNRLDELIKFGRFVMFSPSKRFVYLMGLIDYLGKWNMNKRLEMYGKSILAHFIRQNTDFSVKPPHEFARRFLRKVKRIFRVQKNPRSGMISNNQNQSQYFSQSNTGDINMLHLSNSRGTASGMPYGTLLSQEVLNNRYTQFNDKMSLYEGGSNQAPGSFAYNQKQAVFASMVNSRHTMNTNNNQIEEEKYEDDKSQNDDQTY
eukprot:403371031